MKNETGMKTTLVERKYVLPRLVTTFRKPPIRCRQLKHMIGNTPLLAIRFFFSGKERVVYAKAEPQPLSIC